MKTIFKLILSLALLALSGCSVRTEESRPGQDVLSGNEPDHFAAGQEQLVVTYQTLPTSILRDLDQVTEAVNEITRAEFGVEIVFRPVDESDAFTQYPLWISRNERIDLMMLHGQDITTYINRGMLKSMDDLLEKYGSDITGLLEEGIHVTEGAVIKNTTYGVAPVPELPGKGYGLWLPARLVQETGLAYEENHIYTLEELTCFLEKCKELYPESYPLGQITSGQKTSTYAWYGGNLQAGRTSDPCVLRADGRFVNLYETKEHETFLEYLNRWYQAGYIYPDAAFTDAYLEELVAAGLVLMYPGISVPGMEMEELFGEPCVCLRTSPVILEGGNPSAGFWVIPVTSGNPDAAMKFLNLLYADTRISNLIQYGIASRHYVVLDVESGRISYPYGVSRKSTGYYNPLGLYGDRRQMYTFDTKELIARKQAYLAEALDEPDVYRDFLFETDLVNSELAAIQKVVEKYVPVLESGSVDKGSYEEFLREMQIAGVERVIEEKQRQLEEYKELLREDDEQLPQKRSQEDGNGY